MPEGGVERLVRVDGEPTIVDAVHGRIRGLELGLFHLFVQRRSAALATGGTLQAAVDETEDLIAVHGSIFGEPEVLARHLVVPHLGGPGLELRRAQNGEDVRTAQRGKLVFGSDGDEATAGGLGDAGLAAGAEVKRVGELHVLLVVWGLQCETLAL